MLDLHGVGELSRECPGSLALVHVLKVSYPLAFHLPLFPWASRVVVSLSHRARQGQNISPAVLRDLQDGQYWPPRPHKWFPHNEPQRASLLSLSIMYSVPCSAVCHARQCGVVSELQVFVTGELFARLQPVLSPMKKDPGSQTCWLQ